MLQSATKEDLLFFTPEPAEIQADSLLVLIHKGKHYLVMQQSPSQTESEMLSITGSPDHL